MKDRVGAGLGYPYEQRRIFLCALYPFGNIMSAGGRLDPRILQDLERRYNTSALDTIHFAYVQNCFHHTSGCWNNRAQDFPRTFRNVEPPL